MKCLLFGLGLLLVFFPIQSKSQTGPAVVDCKGARLTGAEQATCSDPELMRLTGEVDNLTKRLERSLTGSNRSVLLDTEGPFVVQRNNCQNEPKGKECVERVLTQRRTGLTASLTSPAAIQGEISKYTFLNIGFFQKNGDRLVGREVNIWGCMTLEPGTNPTSRLHGVIRESCSNATGPSVSVFFKSMTETEATFFDSKTPSTYWKGIVERKDGKLVFTMES